MVQIIRRWNTGATAARTVALAAVLAAGLLTGCQVREDILFDEPKPEFELVGSLGRQGMGGGTLYYGAARNVGFLTGENVTANLVVNGTGPFSGPVGQAFDDNDGVDNDIEPDETGSFEIFVPIPPGAVASESLTFEFDLPDPEAEQ